MEDKTTKRSDKKDKKNVKPLHPLKFALQILKKWPFCAENSKKNKNAPFRLFPQHLKNKIFTII